VDRLSTYRRWPSAYSVSKARLDLPEPLRPGDHHQLVARDVEVDVLEVVRARAANADALGMQQGRERAAGAGVVAIVWEA
jgi:hypothetical protein